MNLNKVKIRDQATEKILEISRLYKKGSIKEKEFKGIITATLIKYEAILEDFNIYYDNKMEEAREIEKELFREI